MPPAVTAPPKPEGPPELSLDATGPKVGFSRIVLQKAEDFDKLQKGIQGVRDKFSGKDVHVIASRDTNTEWVVTMLKDLEGIGATGLFVRTPTRKEFSGELEFVRAESLEFTSVQRGRDCARGPRHRGLAPLWRHGE